MQMDSFLGFEKINKTSRKSKPQFPTERESWFIISAFTILALILITGAKSNFDREMSESSRPLSQFRSLKSAAINFPRTAKIDLDFGNGEIKRFEGQFGTEKDPLTFALNEIADAGRLPIKINGGQIAEINGVDGRHGVWTVYKNGLQIKESLNKLLVGGGDHYKIKYEKL